MRSGRPRGQFVAISCSASQSKLIVSALDGDKNTVRGKQLPKVGETVGVEPQARTSVYRKDYVETSLIQRFRSILR